MSRRRGPRSDGAGGAAADQVRAALQLGAAVVLVVGGTGGTGSIVVRRLLGMHPAPAVRVITRSANRVAIAARFGTDAITVCQGSIGDRAAAEVAVTGATHVVYALGPKQSASRIASSVFGSATTEECVESYVTGLRNVLDVGRASVLRQVVLVSADHVESPWGLSAVANLLSGDSNLNHLRQERMLRAEAAARPDFGYLVVRPGRLTDAPAGSPVEEVAHVSVPARAAAVPTGTVSRAGVAETLVQGLADGRSGVPQRLTVCVSSVGAATPGYRWSPALLAALPDDTEAGAAGALPAEATDVWHTRAKRVTLGVVLLVVAGAVAGVATGVAAGVAAIAAIVR